MLYHLHQPAFIIFYMYSLMRSPTTCIYEECVTDKDIKTVSTGSIRYRVFWNFSFLNFQERVVVSQCNMTKNQGLDHCMKYSPIITPINMSHCTGNVSSN